MAEHCAFADVLIQGLHPHHPLNTAQEIVSDCVSLTHSCVDTNLTVAPSHWPPEKKLDGVAHMEKEVWWPTPTDCGVSVFPPVFLIPRGCRDA